MGVVTQKRTLVFALALTVVGLLASQFAVTLQPAAAQSPDCFEEVYENRTTVVNGQARTVRVVVGEQVKPECLLDDGRVNGADRAAGGVIYCLPDSSVAIYDIDIRGVGELALTATPDEIAAAPALPAENRLVKASDNGAFRLYRLTTGELQLNAPGIYSTDPEYVFQWQGCGV